MNKQNIKYCALTTISNSLKSFVLPSLIELKKQGYEITVSCARDDNFAEMVKDEFTYFPLDISRGFHLSKTIKNIFVLWKFFRKEKFQMIEYGTENIALCASIAGFFARIPVRIYNHWGARYVGLSGFSRILSIWIERLAALFSTDVRQVSHKNAQMCVEDKIYSAKKVKVLGKGGTIGVDFSKFNFQKKGIYRKEILEQLNIPFDSKILGFIGRIQRDKGINELLTVFQKIYEEDNKLYLLLVGAMDSTNPVSVEKLEWAKKCTNVIFVGHVSDVHRYLSTFDIMVHPTYREGFGMVLQEAAALKVTIITTDIVGPGEYVLNNKTGVLVPAKNEHVLYKAIKELLENEEKCMLFAEQNYQYTLENFERSLMVERIIEDRIHLLSEYRKKYMEWR